MRARFRRSNVFEYLLGNSNIWNIRLDLVEALEEDGLDSDYNLVKFIEESFERDISQDNYITKLFIEEFADLEDGVNPTYGELNRLLRKE